MSENRIPTIPQGEERIPTMPQGEERIPTMPQMEERIPTMPQNEERIATLPQTDERVATLPQDDRVATVPQYASSESTSGSLLLNYDCEFIGYYGVKYLLKSKKVVSADSGESQIYECTAEGDTNRYVARILKSITPDSPSEKLMQRNKVIRFLQGISNNPNAHVLPLLDHGTISIGAKSYFIEIYPYCEGGDLGQKKGSISYQTLCEEVIPALNEALNIFHQAGFVHRDIKPDNLYYYKGKVVLGDFGITCELGENNFAIDRTMTGTLGYYAPELMLRAAVKASDYYSFGQTLWTLYSGEMMYQNIFRRFRSEGEDEQRNQINIAMMNDTYYGLEDIKQEERFFEILIRGLLQYDVGSRFDYDKVKRWLQQDRSLVHDIKNFNDMETFPVPFHHASNQFWTNEQLFSGLRNDWDAAKEYLYSGGLKSFFQHINPRLANEIDQIAKRYSKPTRNSRISQETTYDIGVSQMFLALNKGECLVWGNISYNNILELAADNAPLPNPNCKYHASELGILQSGLFIDWYRTWQKNHKQKADEYVLKVLSDAHQYALQASEVKDFNAVLSRAIVSHVFKALKGESVFEGCNKIDEFIANLCQMSEGIYGYLQTSILDNPKFYAFLYAQGFDEFAGEMLMKRHTSFERVELLFYFLEQQCEEKTLKEQLVDFYINHGPEAYMLWFKNNLHLYDFNGEEAIAIREEVESCTIEGMTIGEVKACYNSLLNVVTRFRTLFVDNVYLVKMGLTNGKENDGITSKHLFAYWNKQLFGRDVPIGFDIS